MYLSVSLCLSLSLSLFVSRDFSRELETQGKRVGAKINYVGGRGSRFAVYDPSWFVCRNDRFDRVTCSFSILSRRERSG